METLASVNVPLLPTTQQGAIEASISTEDDYNERYQALIEREWDASTSVETGLENGLLLQDVVGAFLNAAAETARPVVILQRIFLD